MLRIRFLLPLLLILGLAVSASAQTTLTSTTLASAMSTTNGTIANLASTTGVTSAGTGATLIYLLVDREMMAVRNATVPATSGPVQVIRGQSGTRAASHISGATVWVLPPAAIQPYIPSGQCTRTSLPYVPVVVIGAGLSSDTGSLWDCLGVTTAGQWVQTAPSLGVSIVGTTVSSATTLGPTGTYFVVSGTANPVSTITVPAGWLPGNCLALEPSGTFVTGTGGNISIASTAVVGKMLFMCWNGLKWNPSY